MITRDYRIWIILGLLSGISTGILISFIYKIIPRRPVIKVCFSCLGPGIVWFAATIVLLISTGTAIPDWIAMQIFLTGSFVFPLSILGVILRKIIPIMSNSIVFITTLTALSLCIQIVYFNARMP